jgi:iron donor protein CyaY
MNETAFQSLAAATLAQLSQALEPAYETGALDDLVLKDGVLTITTGNARVFVVSKHSPTQQIWLASPLSGGLHFTYAEQSQTFQLSNGRTLHEALRHDLTQCGIEAIL